MSNLFSAGTSFREGGKSFVVTGSQASSRKLSDQETGETTLQSLHSLRTRLKANEIELDDLLSTGHETPKQPEPKIERGLADHSEKSQLEVKVKLYYLDRICPRGYMQFPKCDLKAELEKAHAEFSLKRPGLPRPDAPPGVSTIYKWLKEWRASGFSATSLINRFDLSGRRPTPIAQELGPIFELAIDRFFASEARPTIKGAQDFIEGQVTRFNLIRAPVDQLPRPTRRQIERALAKQDRYATLLKRYGKAVAERLTRIHKTKAPTDRILERVEVDHTPLDLICVTDDGVFLGRPYLTVLIDVHSRMILSAWISFRYGNGMSLEQHQACRKHALETYKSLPHRDAMLAAKAELIEEGLRIKENHAAFLQRLKRHECKQKRRGNGDEKATWSRQADPSKDHPNRKGPRKDRSGVQLQARTELVKVDRSPPQRAAAPAEPLLSFEGLTPFSADQSTLF